MDDQDVAVRPSGDALADAAAEQPLEEAGFAGADDDQVGVLLLGELDDLLVGNADDAGKLDAIPAPEKSACTWSRCCCQTASSVWSAWLGSSAR